MKGILLFSSGTFIIERPTQPDQIRAREEEAGMFVWVGVKLDLNFHTFWSQVIPFIDMLIKVFL